MVSTKLRRLFRYTIYALLLVWAFSLLVAYVLYLCAQTPPEFYRQSLTVPWETQQQRNNEMLDKIRVLNNDVQQIEQPWAGRFSTEELNAYLAVEATKPGANLLPSMVKEPRISFSDKAVEFACKVEQGPFKGIVHFVLGLTVPEPNRLVLRIKGARIGALPIALGQAAQFLKTALETDGREVVQGSEAGDPTLSFAMDLKYGKDKSLQLEGMDFFDGVVQFTGSTEKKAARD